MTKEEFLKKLSGKTRKYKRYTGLPLRYRGGKSLLVGFIVEQLPDKVDRVISPFFGGGSVEIAIARELNIPVIGFDIFDMLVNYWQVQIQTPEKLFSLLPEKVDRPGYFAVLDKLLQERDDKNLYAAKEELAADFWINHNLSFGPDSFSHYPSEERFETKRYAALTHKVRDFHVRNIEVHRDSFEQVLPEFPEDFLYVDPPYYVDGKTTYCALYPNVHEPYFHAGFNHALLAELLHAVKGEFILSYNDCPFVREAYRDFTFIEVPIKYGLNTIKGKSKDMHELLIKNY